jgi:phosphoribosylformimino-5-aminoimidazole carboxamide ribotide isomerase
MSIVSSFTLFPAIDLLEGRCVRLKQGDVKQSTVYHDDAGAQASAFADQGFDHLHVVDLDGAFAGKPAKVASVRAILSSFTGFVQVGGGIRTMASVAGWLEAGVSRVIIGTAAVQHPAFVAEACKAYPGRVAVGIDARNGLVAVDGWAAESTLKAVDVAKRFEDVGVSALITTDISRDGMLSGPNLDATCALAAAVSLPVIVSGGMSVLSDVHACLKAQPPLAGAILGRSLYEGTIKANEALALVRTSHA